MKKTYIQPEIETAIMPKGALMDPLVLAGSSTMGTVGGGAPRRRDQVF